MRNDVPLNQDLLTGCRAIAQYLGWPERKTYFVAQQGHLPIRAVGRSLIARKSELNGALSAAAKTAEVA